MNILSEFGLDPEKFALGSLCKREHDFEGTTGSLRYKHANGKAAGCVECRKVNEKRWRNENRERVNELRREYYKRTPIEKTRQATYTWRKENPERFKAHVRKYYKKHQYKRRLAAALYRKSPEGKLAYSKGKRAYKARLAKVHVSRFSSAELRERLSLIGDRCIYCGSNFYSWDHFLPVSLGGPDVLGNLIPCCRSCNSSKQAQDPLEWYKSQHFYSLKQWKKILRILGKTPETYNQIPLL